MSYALAKSANYNAPINYIFGASISEYDIAKANISILFDMNMISESQYNTLLHADRDQREFSIGCMQRDDPSISQALSEGMEKARIAFCEKMGLNDNQILHINKDAIFFIWSSTTRNSIPDVQVGPHVHFTNRGVYSYYMKLGPALNVYGTTSFADDDTIKVRGMSEEIYNLHKNHFLKVINEIMHTQAFVGSQAAYHRCRGLADTIAHIPESEENGSIELCRRFDAFGMFDMITMSNWSDFQLKYIGSNDARTSIDPKYNIGVLNTIGNYLMDDIMRHLR